MLEPTVKVLHRGFISYTLIQPFPVNVLYFGCRSSSKDQHFGDEWRSYEKDQSLQYRTAFSRDGPEGVKRMYVQDLIRDDAEQIWRLVGEQMGWVLISG
jgi:sulfite reductase alpha subunit-like flavoprotein